MKLDTVIAARAEKTVYRDSDKCIKAFIAGYSKANVYNEALNIARIEETGLNTPELIEVTTLEDGRTAIVSKFIDGKTLAELMEECPEKKGEYMDLFINLQMAVHEKSCPQLSSMKDSMNRKIIQCDLDATTRYDLFVRLDEMPRHNKLCHGDFIPDNIIITADGTPYIIDWSHATRGNASADAARTYLLFWLKGDISGAEKYLELFCERTGIEKQYIMLWMPLVAAAQSVQCSDKEREFLLSWTKNTNKSI